jgi:hypothetical protein
VKEVGGEDLDGHVLGLLLILKRGFVFLFGED